MVTEARKITLAAARAAKAGGSRPAPRAPERKGAQWVRFARDWRVRNRIGMEDQLEDEQQAACWDEFAELLEGSGVRTSAYQERGATPVPSDDVEASDAGLMCEANGCPNRWAVAVDGRAKLCSAHAWADSHQWPAVTEQQQRAHDARKVEAPAGKDTPVTWGPGPGGWADELLNRRDGGKALTWAERDHIRRYRPGVLPDEPAPGRADPKAWAKRIIAKQEDGVQVNRTSLTMAMVALGMVKSRG